MADLTTANSTYSAGPIDTFTSLSDVSDEMLSSHINGGLSAIIAIEGDLGAGASLKRSRTTLVARLDTILDVNGAIQNGTAFPTSPTPVEAQLFWRSDLNQLYIYDVALAQWQRIDSSNDHGTLGGLLDDDHTIYSLVTGAREFTGNVDTAANLRFKSGTGFQMTLDHAATAARTITFPDATGALVLSGSIVDGDIGASAAIAQSKLVDIVDADISTSAAIGNNKLANLPALGVNPSPPRQTSIVNSEISDVKLAKLQRIEVSGTNAGSLTVPVTFVTVATVDLLTVNSGDRILVFGTCLVIKGATSGETGAWIQKLSGSATVTTPDVRNIWQAPNIFGHAASIAEMLVVSVGIFSVTVTGTLVLAFQASSDGSDGTIGVGGGNFTAIVLNNG